MSNPFDELGLKKDLVQFLYRNGRLDDFLKQYRRTVQVFVHTDRGGNHDLSTTVNSAFDEIKRNTGNVSGWVDSMRNGNGASAEVEAVLEGLVGEVERLRKVELDYQDLRSKYASILAGGSVSAASRPAPEATRRRTAEPAEAPPRRAAPEATARRPAPEPRAEARPRTPPRPAPADYAGYVLMPTASTYARGMEALRTAIGTEATAHPFVTVRGSRMYRPLTFKEDLKACVENYEKIHHEDGSERSMEERLFLITERWKDSCTGMGYKAGTTKFKVIPQSQDLITLAPEFNDAFKPVSYRRLEGVQLDSSRGTYNTDLTKAQVLEHPGWLAAVEEDRRVLSTYTNIVFAELQRLFSRTTGMGFYVRANTEKDELRALFVSYLNGSSCAFGFDDLIDYGSFLRVAHR